MTQSRATASLGWMNAEKDHRTARGTIRALAGARAIPPLIIVLYHFSEGHHYSGVQWWDRIVTRGYLWVEFFFVLSGFILTYSYGHRMRELLTWRGYGAFLRARLIRLYPVHLFMLLLILVMVLVLRNLANDGGYTSIFDLKYHQDVSVKGFVLSLLLMNGWHTMDRLTWNGLSWFVSVEFALCLMFPAILWFSVRGGRWRGPLLVAAGQHGLDQTYDWGLARGLSEFLVGAGLAVLFGGVDHQRIPVWVHSAGQSMLLLLLAYSVTFTGWSHGFNDIYTVLPIMGLVFALAFDRGVVADLLKARPLQRIGDWSYAIYLGQTAWLLVIRYFANAVYPPPDTPVLGTTFFSLMWWLEPLLLVLACLGWGAALAEWVEKPASRFLRNRLGRRLDPKSIPTPS